MTTVGTCAVCNETTDEVHCDCPALAARLAEIVEDTSGTWPDIYRADAKVYGTEGLHPASLSDDGIRAALHARIAASGERSSTAPPDDPTAMQRGERDCSVDPARGWAEVVAVTARPRRGPASLARRTRPLPEPAAGRRRRPWRVRRLPASPVGVGWWWLHRDAAQRRGCGGRRGGAGPFVRA